MVLKPRQREERVREIRNVLLEAARAPTHLGALRKEKEAAQQLVILIRLETGGDGGDAAQAETVQLSAEQL